MYRMLPGSLTNFNNFFAYLDPYLMYSGKREPNIFFERVCLAAGLMEMSTGKTTAYNKDKIPGPGLLLRNTSLAETFHLQVSFHSLPRICPLPLDLA